MRLDIAMPSVQPFAWRSVDVDARGQSMYNVIRLYCRSRSKAKGETCTLSDLPLSSVARSNLRWGKKMKKVESGDACSMDWP
jgi:hypothetical protein